MLSYHIKVCYGDHECWSLTDNPEMYMYLIALSWRAENSLTYAKIIWSDEDLHFVTFKPIRLLGLRHSSQVWTHHIWVRCYASDLLNTSKLIFLIQAGRGSSGLKIICFMKATFWSWIYVTNFHRYAIVQLRELTSVKLFVCLCSTILNCNRL